MGKEEGGGEGREIRSKMTRSKILNACTLLKGNSSNACTLLKGNSSNVRSL